jgi:hypothetical protein
MRRVGIDWNSELLARSGGLKITSANEYLSIGPVNES